MVDGDSAIITYEKNKTRRNYTWDHSGNQFAWVKKGDVYVQYLDSVGTAEPLNLTKDKAFTDADSSKSVKFSVNRWSRDGDRLLLTSKKAGGL